MKASFIRVKRIRNGRFAYLLKEFIDDGEAEAIVLAVKSNSDLIIIG